MIQREWKGVFVGKSSECADSEQQKKNKKYCVHLFIFSERKMENTIIN